jgi:hypothetical protein
LEEVPVNDLTVAMNTIRQSVGIGMEVLNPQNILSRFRSGYGILTELAPNNLLGVSLSLPVLKLNFEARASSAPPEHQAAIASISARFDVVFNAVTPSVSGGQMQQLIQEHNALLNALRLRINALDHSSAQANYALLRNNLEKLLPDFLRQPQPLTHADIIAGLYGMRPSTKARQFEIVLERFLLQLHPYEEAIEPGVNEFFNTLRDLIALINPLSVREAVSAIYDEIREKVRIIDPETLQSQLQGLLDTVTAPLNAINPSEIKAQINGVYNSALSTLTTNVKAILEDLTAAINQALRSIQTAFKTLIAQVRESIAAIIASIQNVFDRLEELVFVDILQRLDRVIDNLGMSFDAELDRVRNAFDAMLDAIPLEASVEASVSA